MRLPKPVREARTPKPLRRGPVKRSRVTKHRKKRVNLKKLCNDLWAKWVKRDGRCRFLGEWVGGNVHTQCGNGLQAMHGFPKKVYPGVRYAEWNGFSGCGRVHSYYTWREPEWQNFLRHEWGSEVYEERLRVAASQPKNDLVSIAATYRTLLEK